MKDNWLSEVDTFFVKKTGKAFLLSLFFRNAPLMMDGRTSRRKSIQQVVLNIGDFLSGMSLLRLLACQKNLLDSLLTASFINRQKIYIGGLSQGGMGVYDMIARYPEIFAAAFAICGAGKVSTSEKFAKEVAIWIFHGKLDDVVPVSFSKQYYKRLKKLGADVRYSEYPGIKHNSWTNAFAEKDLLPWLFSKSKK